MHANTVDFLIPKFVFTVVALTASLVSPMSQAQQVYRIVKEVGMRERAKNQSDLFA